MIDRFGNRELLYLDPAVSSKRPTLLQKRPHPPVLTSAFDPDLAAQGLGQFTVQDVYTGLGSSVAKSRVRYLQVSQKSRPRSRNCRVVSIATRIRAFRTSTPRRFTWWPAQATAI